MKGYIYSDQLPMFGHKEIIGYGTDDFYVKEIEKDLANKIIIENHYSKKVYNATYIHLGVFIKKRIYGCIAVWLCYEPSKL